MNEGQGEKPFRELPQHGIHPIERYYSVMNMEQRTFIENMRKNNIPFRKFSTVYLLRAEDFFERLKIHGEDGGQEEEN